MMIMILKMFLEGIESLPLARGGMADNILNYRESEMGYCQKMNVVKTDSSSIIILAEAEDFLC